MKIAIIANGPTNRNFTDNPTIKKDYDEVWGLNQIASWKGLKLDKCFIMDDLKLRMPYYAGFDFTDWLKAYKQPIITSKQYDEWPTSEAFPIYEIAEYFGLPLGIAMYSTPDYMIALAIYKGATQIDLFGVDMTEEKKGAEEMRASTAQWIGAAHARGVLTRTFSGSFFQYYTNPGIAMEMGLYGYAQRPRIEDLVNKEYYEAWKNR